MSQQGEVIPLRAVKDAWSIQEFKDTFSRMDEVDYAQLTHAVAPYAAIARMMPLDLLQEAVTRTLEGDRNWSRKVPLVAFLVGAARSIASAEFKYRERSEVRSPVSVYNRDGDLEHHGEAHDGSPEEQLIAKEQYSIVEAELESLFADDEAAWLIYSSLLDGNQGESVRLETGLDLKEFATKRKMVRRRLNAYRTKRGERA